MSSYTIVGGSGGPTRRERATPARGSGEPVVRARLVVVTDRCWQCRTKVRGVVGILVNPSRTPDGTGFLYTERAFIQIAGFTFGKTQSYFDFVGGAVCYGCGYGGHLSQFGAGGTIVFAYSATLGNGLTATIALEDGRPRSD